MRGFKYDQRFGPYDRYLFYRLAIDLQHICVPKIPIEEITPQPNAATQPAVNQRSQLDRTNNALTATQRPPWYSVYRKKIAAATIIGALVGIYVAHKYIKTRYLLGPPKLLQSSAS